MAHLVSRVLLPVVSGIRDDAYEVIEFLMRLTFERTEQDPVTGPALRRIGLQGDDFQAMAVVVGLLITLWAIWALVFSDSPTPDAEGQTQRLVRWLLRAVSGIPGGRTQPHRGAPSERLLRADRTSGHRDRFVDHAARFGPRVLPLRPAFPPTPPRPRGDNVPRPRLTVLWYRLGWSCECRDGNFSARSGPVPVRQPMPPARLDALGREILG